jgi:ABC-type branched-subunit amino acid transport system substrate-binding protein
MAGPRLGTGPRISGETVEIALLLPLSSPQGGDAIIARSLENAARLAATEQTGVTIDLRVYNTDGNPATAATVARQAVQEGADVILGPLRSESAAAVGVAVANSGVAVLSFSNNAEVAGGNVFVLGNTFANTSDRIVSYAARRGAGNIVVVHAANLAGEVAATRCAGPPHGRARRSRPRYLTSSRRPASSTPFRRSSMPCATTVRTRSC